MSKVLRKKLLPFLLAFSLLLPPFESSPARAADNGTTTITPDGTGNGSGTMEISLTITGTITNDGIAFNSDTFEYDGTAKKPTVTVTYTPTGGTAQTLVKDTDYTVSIKDSGGNIATEPKNAGTYTVVVAAKDGSCFTGSGEKTYTITKANPSAPAAPTKASADKNSITLTAHDGYQYSKDGTTWQDSNVFTGLSPGTEYSFCQRVKGTSNTNESSASPVAKFSTDADTYAMTITLVINPAQTITAADVTATYGDTDKSVSASVTEPASGGGTISYAVKEGSADYIDVAADGKLTIKKVPTNGKAYVIVKAAETDGYAETTKEVTVTISKAEATVTAKNQSIMVGGTVPDLSAPVLDTHYTVTGLLGTDALMTTPTLAYQKDGSAVTPNSATAGSYDIVASGASAGDNYTITYANGTLTVSDKQAQTITANNVTVTYGETGKSVSATVTDPATGGGTISYAVKEGSAEYINVTPSTGVLTIKKVPADGKAYVTVTAAGNAAYEQATKDVTVTINKANSSVAKAPEAKTLTYNGSAQALVTAGEATGGEMQYAFGTASEATQPYTTSIPTATNAGTYYVWYKVIGDKNHSDFTADQAVLVEIKADTTAPTGEISIDTNKWTSFLSTITFGLFFKETKEVTITAEDDLTGVQKIEYYVSDQAISLEQVKAVTEWTTYAFAFKLNPEKKYVVYARLTDKAGNTGYISSDGLVLVNLPVGYVTDIDTDSAKLNMKLSDSVRTEIKAAGFEYKKKADADTAWTKVAADSVTKTVTKEITSLTAGTDYVFRPYVTYTNDTTDIGAEKGFTTDTKPAVTGSIAVKVKNETDGTKDVIVTIEEGNYALASQEKDGIAAGGEVTTGKFKELPDGTYNIVIKSKDGEFVETKMITIADGAAETIFFTISKGEMKTDVEVEADTPKVAVDGLSKEELVQSGTITPDEKTKVESGEISLEVTLKAEKKETSKVETKTVSAIQQVMAESSTKLVVDMFLDLSLFKTVTQLTGDQAGDKQETDIGSTNKKVLEIAVPYDTTIKGLMVYRYHGSAASVLKKLSSAPAKGAAYEDGSFYLSDKYIHIFASGFSTYAIAKEEESSSGGSGGGGGTTPVTPGKTTPAKPSAPTLDSKTETSITVKAVAGQEYSIDGGKTWQTSGTFTGLTPETEYSIVTKITATSTTNESPVSDALTVTTDKKADPSTPTPTDKPTETPGSTTKPTETPTTPTETPASQKDKVTKTEKAAAKISINAGLKVSQSGKKVTVKWGKVSKADRYVVYAAYCGPDKCTKIKALSGSKTSMTFTKLNGSKLNLKKNVKVYVVAYRKVNGKETKLARSITAHIVGTKNTKYTNVKKIKLSKSKYTLKVNKTATIKAKIVLVDKKKKQLSDSHAPEFRYASSNTKVATVNKSGKITAVKKGTCYIYVYAKNGYAKKVKVTVK